MTRWNRPSHRFLFVVLLAVLAITNNTYNGMGKGNVVIDMHEVDVRVAIARTNESISTTNAIPNAQPEVWLWCALIKDNSLFHHFPHTAEKCLPCWSWFQRMREMLSKDTTTHCGLYLNGDLPLDPEGWAGRLVEHMGCSVTRSDPFISENSAPTMVYHLKNNTQKPFEWFQRPEDARSLREKVLQSINCSDINPTTQGVRIAGIDRNTRVKNRRKRVTRSLLNIANITQALKIEFPAANVVIAYMEDMQVDEQFAFWSQHDIIVAAHGAALTNAIFLPPGGGSAVIEIFPHHFYWTEFYATLLKRSGLRGYGYYNNVTDIKADYAAHSRNHSDVMKYREQNLNPPVEAIVDLVKQALADGGYGPGGERPPKVRPKP